LCWCPERAPAPGYRSAKAVTETRELVIEATPDEILDVLLDLESFPEWSSPHKEVEILERDDQGHPSKSRQVVKVAGISDTQVLDHSVYDHGVGWAGNWSAPGSSVRRPAAIR
jgi:hypothetical protein